MAFVKFDKLDKDPSGQPLHWCRSDLDGMPFRGPALPLRNEEFDEFTETACDAYAQTFDTSDPAQLMDYRKVLEGASNQWYQVLFRQHRWVEREGKDPVMLVYIEWSIPHKELSTRFKNAMLDTPAISLLGSNGHGSSNGG